MPKCDNHDNLSFFFSKPNVMDHPYQMVRRKYTKCAKQRKEDKKPEVPLHHEINLFYI